MASALGGAALAPAGAKRALTREGLIVEPEILVAVAVVDAVDHHGHPLHLGVPAGGLTGVEDHWSSAVLRQPPFDFPHQLFALFLIGFRRLLVDQLVDLRTAIA